MIAALTHASSDKADECTFYIFKVRCSSEKRDNSQRAKLYKIVTKRLIKSEKKVATKVHIQGTLSNCNIPRDHTSAASANSF